MNSTPQGVERVTLPDGTQLAIRAVRPDDRERVVRAFAKLDRESVYTRYFTFKRELSEAELAHLDAMDSTREAMLVATVDTYEGETIVGTCRYIAQDAPGAAEVAFTIEEDYQGRGIAGRLLERLASIARANGITRFEAVVLKENRAMLRVFERTGRPMTTRREDDTIAVTLAL
jgi:RimJ/RimL family protein N-acetyltransferase